MKKYLLTLVALFSTTLFAATDAQIVEHFKSTVQVPNITITIVSRKPVEGIDGMDFVTLSLSDGTRSQKLSIFTKDDLIFPDVISIKQGGSIKEMMEMAELQKKLSAIYKKEEKKNVISLGNDPKKETLVVFTDPECPYCRQELAQIEQRLTTNNLKLIFTPVHERSSLEKSVIIYNETSKVKTDADKIKILKKYYDENVKYEQKISDADVAHIDALKLKYFGAGIKGVPFIVKEKELLK
ncbi:thioredoxin domain-containing protein [Sulfurospirillum multivorans]|uniref:Periplasmic thioredoxin domain-containing protein n=2 Tax=Sulfurospirillum multivorans TaxID=66821 RepID=A0AA86AP81_SULMK|nr:thioredoxin domain-containing protein [Sulfurospirillum multivorans]AHJ14154.1 putative periplasmic thioredoxin domain-containing protein [Sulfurospirillum multivorans DSM 12446]QEH07639.1 putative periplasmic thioredoxin domain-containing protein [Sulfurospirillum multivorans]